MMKSNLELQAERNRAARLRNGLAVEGECWCGAPPEGSAEFAPSFKYSRRHSREGRLPTCDGGAAAVRIANQQSKAKKKLTLV